MEVIAAIANNKILLQVVVKYCLSFKIFIKSTDELQKEMFEGLNDTWNFLESINYFWYIWKEGLNLSSTQAISNSATRESKLHSWRTGFFCLKTLVTKTETLRNLFSFDNILL